VNLSVAEKLNHDNFWVWQAMMLSDICGAQLFGILDRTMPVHNKEVKAMTRMARRLSSLTLIMHVGFPLTSACLGT
jgi:hypothetical protein